MTACSKRFLCDVSITLWACKMPEEDYQMPEEDHQSVIERCKEDLLRAVIVQDPFCMLDYLWIGLHVTVFLQPRSQALPTHEKKIRK